MASFVRCAYSNCSKPEYNDTRKAADFKLRKIRPCEHVEVYAHFLCSEKHSKKSLMCEPCLDNISLHDVAGVIMKHVRGRVEDIRNAKQPLKSTKEAVRHIVDRFEGALEAVAATHQDREPRFVNEHQRQGGLFAQGFVFFDQNHRPSFENTLGKVAGRTMSNGSVAYNVYQERQLSLGAGRRHSE